MFELCSLEWLLKVSNKKTFDDVKNNKNTKSILQTLKEIYVKKLVLRKK